MVGICWVGLIFVCSFDVTPIALADKVLVQLVLLRCEVVSVEFLCRKSASHLSIHVKLLLLYDASCVGYYYNDRRVLHELGLGHKTRGWVGQATQNSYTM